MLSQPMSRRGAATNIAEWRRRIDGIDRRLVRLLSQRARCSLAIGRRKRDQGLPLFYRRRERQVAENARRANRGPLPDSAVGLIFAQILRATRAVVRRSLGRAAGTRQRAGR